MQCVLTVIFFFLLRTLAFTLPGKNEWRTTDPWRKDQQQQTICSLLKPCAIGEIIPDGTECACSGVTYHGRDGLHVSDITVACSKDALVDLVYSGFPCPDQHRIDADRPKEVRCYGAGVGCAAGPYTHWSKSYDFKHAANKYMEGNFVHRRAEERDLNTIAVKTGTSLQIVGLPYGVRFVVYKNWQVDNWEPGGLKQKCFNPTGSADGNANNWLPRLRAAHNQRLFSVESGGTLKLQNVELAGTAQVPVEPKVGKRAIHVAAGGTFIGSKVWFVGWAIAGQGGALYVAGAADQSTLVELHSCEFGGDG